MHLSWNSMLPESDNGQHIMVVLWAKKEQALHAVQAEVFFSQEEQRVRAVSLRVDFKIHPVEVMMLSWWNLIPPVLVYGYLLRRSCNGRRIRCGGRRIDNVFIGGDTYSPNVSNCIATQYGFQTSLGGSENHFIAAFTTNGIRLQRDILRNPTWGRMSHRGYNDGGVRVRIYERDNRNCFRWFSKQLWRKSLRCLPGKIFSFRSGYGRDCKRPDFLPTVTSTPVVITGVSIFNGGGISISSCSLRNFPPGIPLPTSGSVFQTIACDFTGMYSNGSPATLVTCPATLTVKTTYAGTHGSTNVYDAELMQLDLAAGVLPSGIILRESPTRVSSGKILSTSLGSGAYKMACYFEANMELSTNSGASWSRESLLLICDWARQPVRVFLHLARGDWLHSVCCWWDWVLECWRIVKGLKSFFLLDSGINLGELHCK